MNLGRSARVPAKLVERAVLRHVATTMKENGLDVPNERDLLKKARVSFRGLDGQLVALADAVVTWEE